MTSRNQLAARPRQSELQRSRARDRAARAARAAGPGRKAIARLVNDRRIAENTARIPHPYGVDDADQFIAGANRRGRRRPPSHHPRRRADRLLRRRPTR